MKDRSILVVDDDPRVRSLLSNVLEDEGFNVLEAETSAEVLQIVEKAKISLITLDVSLGPENGIELARQIRKISQVPVIMVSGKDDVIDRVVGLEVGADDYITKPFHIREVMARIRSVLRRADAARAASESKEAEAEKDQGESGGGFYYFDGMTAIPDRLELKDRDGANCGLTSGDFQLLNVFLNRPKRVLSRDQLMDLKGGMQWNPLDRTIDNQIARLRKKIERDPADPKLIKTVRGVGYMFACDVQVVPPPKGEPRSA